MSFDKKYNYDEVLAWIVDAVAPLGPDYQALMRKGFASRWIDVYENEGNDRRVLGAGVRHPPVHAAELHRHHGRRVHDGHEMGHSMHTILSHETQPFIYSDYTIFVAEVPSTLSEALLLEYMLAKSSDPVERIVLLQHAIDNITGTFFTQVMFADYELRAHRLTEQDQPITAEILTDTYTQLLKDYYGDAIDMNAFTGITWSRIPHFFNSPYYVYQYATCFASAAKIAKQIMGGGKEAEAARTRFLDLLRSGGSDYPMELLRKAGVDLAQPDTVLAVVDQLDDLVTRLETRARQTLTTGYPNPEPLGRRGGGVGPFAKHRFLGTKRHPSAVYKRMPGRDPGAVHERPVGAPPVLDGGAPAGNHDVRVLPRHAGRVDPDAAVRAAADDVLPFGQRQDRVLPHQPPADGAVGAWRIRRAGHVDVRREAIAAARNRPHESRRARIVAERLPNLGHGVPEIGLEHHRVRPEPVLQLGLRDQRRPPLDRGSAAGRTTWATDGRGSPSAPQLARRRIELERTEADPHRVSAECLRFPCDTGSNTSS